MGEWGRRGVLSSDAQAVSPAASFQLQDSNSYLDACGVGGKPADATSTDVAGGGYVPRLSVVFDTNVYRSLGGSRFAALRSYEQEWRILAPLPEASKVIHGSAEAVYLFAFPPTCITGVVLGARSSPELRGAVESITRDPDFAHLRLFKAVLDPKPPTIRIEDVRNSVGRRP
jgi:hypothetical protein